MTSAQPDFALSCSQSKTGWYVLSNKQFGSQTSFLTAGADRRQLLIRITLAETVEDFSELYITATYK